MAGYFAKRARGGVGLMVTGGFAPNIAGWTKPFAGMLASSGAAPQAGHRRRACGGRQRMVRENFSAARVFIVAATATHVTQKTTTREQCLAWVLRIVHRHSAASTFGIPGSVQQETTPWIDTDYAANALKKVRRLRRHGAQCTQIVSKYFLYWANA